MEDDWQDEEDDVKNTWTEKAVQRKEDSAKTTRQDMKEGDIISGNVDDDDSDLDAKLDELINHKKKEAKQSEESSKSKAPYIDTTEEKNKPSVIYHEIGDRGSAWRMMKLSKVSATARDGSLPVEKVALQQYGSLELYDEAREEQIELNLRRKTGKESKKYTNGDLYVQRFKGVEEKNSKTEGEKVVVVPGMYTKDRSLHKDENDMTVDELYREARAQNKKRRYEATDVGAEGILKDKAFKDDLEYLDENAAKLASTIKKSKLDLRNMGVNEFRKVQKMIEQCPLCFKDETDRPVAPVVSLATRVYLSLPTLPALTKLHCLIVPLAHHTNTLECDEDEWEEIRNFMKRLTIMFDNMNMGVIFYEDAAAPERRRHAMIEVIPIPYAKMNTAPAFFKEAILSRDEEWSQHTKIIDTLAKARSGFGKMAFRKHLVPQMPYFHVWFEIDGGYGHVVEDRDKWGKNEYFAREVFAGILDLSSDVWHRLGRWSEKDAKRIGPFRKVWDEYDWTASLNTSNISY